MRRFLIWVAALAGAVVVGMTTEAATFPLKNSSFEAPALPTEGKQTKDEAEAWKITGSAGVFVNNGEFGNKLSGVDGAQMGFLNGAQASSLSQNVADQFQPATTYKLKVGVGLRKGSSLAKGSSLLLRFQSF